MALQNLVGSGLWLPTVPLGFDSNNILAANDITLDADEEEVQYIGHVHIDGGGSKTFGTSGSKIGWLAGASITFAANSTLRVGVKKAATVDAANGPAARATIGAAAFDVYDDLVGGTDTISNTTWRDDAMSAGTPYTVADGELIAVCFHLDTTSGTPSVKVRSSVAFATGMGFPATTLITSGPTYTAQANGANIILIFDDGTLGWITQSSVFSVAGTSGGTIGDTNIHGNIFQVPFTCKIDALAATVTATTGDFALDLYSTPLGTPSLVESVAMDANIQGNVIANRFNLVRLTTPRTLSINTDYAIGVRQTTATAVAAWYIDVSTAAYLKAWGMGAECYGATSTAGATFAAANSGKRRYGIFARVCALDDGVSAGGGGRGLIFGG